jgi:hypothetical protein
VGGDLCFLSDLGGLDSTCWLGMRPSLQPLFVLIPFILSNSTFWSSTRVVSTSYFLFFIFIFGGFVALNLTRGLAHSHRRQPEQQHGKRLKRCHARRDYRHAVVAGRAVDGHDRAAQRAGTVLCWEWRAPKGTETRVLVPWRTTSTQGRTIYWFRSGKCQKIFETLESHRVWSRDELSRRLQLP